MGHGDARQQGGGWRSGDGHAPLRPRAPLVRALARRWARRRAARLAALYDFATLLAGERDLDRLLHALVTGLAARFAYRYVSVFLLEEGQLRLRAQVGYVTPIATLALGEGITGIVGRDGRPTLVRDGRRHPGYLFAEVHFGSQASVPLARAGRIVGVLNLEGAVGELGAADLRLLAALAAPAAVAIENAALVARLTAQATRDPLTGLLNRRGILAALDAALAQAGASAPVSILLADLNGFKGVNDRCGHAAGDRILAELAGLLAASARGAATVGRLGGDEFLVILPGADAAAEALVDRLRAAFAAYPCPVRGPDGTPPPLGYSLGLATAAAAGANAAAMLLRADRALYDAKRRGGGIRFLPAAAVADRHGV
jgi:diguanylate cyclase (GGDEF)-like protein